jgi:PAS domain S-box-containing protein
MDNFNFLLLEDVYTDAELIIRTLKQSGINFSSIVVQGRKDFIEAIKEHKFDAILSDNALPQFSAAEALEICNENGLAVPFILITGAISEEYAVRIMKLGACDYILKDRMQRLPNAVVNAIEKCNLEAERKKYLDEVVAHEALMKEAEQLAHFGSWEADMVNFTQRWSDEQFRILGFEPGEIQPSISNFLSMVHPEDLEFVKEILDSSFMHVERQVYMCRIISKDGKLKHIHGEMAVKRDEKGKAYRLNGFIRDITDTKLAEVKEKQITSDLIQQNKDLQQFAYIVSHNLRAPVANIVGVTNILLEEDLSNEQRDEFMEGLSGSVQKLDEVIIDLNNILQVKHHLKENKEQVNFLHLVDDIKSSIGADDHVVKIRCDFEEVPEIDTLKSYMHSIFYNLISNSIKFRKQNEAPVIEIKTSKNKDKIELTFKDNGIGIDMEKRGDQVFGLYKRFHPGYADGKGMGLYMVKTHVETMGGKISVKSNVNEGIEFKIEFDQENSFE